MLNKEENTLVTGATGMVGAALVKTLKQNGFENVLTPTRKELNLMDHANVINYFAKFQPRYVFMIGAKVGGIAANMTDPVGFLIENLQMQLNLFQSCYKYQVKKILFLGSSCIYPRECPQPMKEEHLLTGPLEPSNEGYALAKIVGLKLAQYYYQQYGMITVCPMPCNIYGTNDHFDFQRAHVLSALVRRFVDAQDEGRSAVTIWGTGIARREFIHVQDAADALLFLMERLERPEIINVGTGIDITIRDLAQMIAQEVGYRGPIKWDAGKPDGMLHKCLEISKLTQLGFYAKIDLKTGIRQTIFEYRQLKMKGCHLRFKSEQF